MFTRATGQPKTETRTISTAGFRAPFTLRLVNGDTQGRKRVSSARVVIDGVEVLGAAAFSNKAAGYTLPVALQAQSVLAVTIASTPGDFFTIAVEGEPDAVEEIT